MKEKEVIIKTVYTSTSGRPFPVIKFEEWGDEDPEESDAIMESDAALLADILMKTIPSGTYEKLIKQIKQREEKQHEEQTQTRKH